MTREELKKMIAERDNLTMDEVNCLFDDVQSMIDEALTCGTGIEDMDTDEYIEGLLRDELGIEPDYIDLFL